MPIDPDTLVRMLIQGRARTLAYITAIVRDDHLAEDVFQDISAIAYAKRDQIDGAEHLMGWLRVAARQQALKAMRDRQAAGRPLGPDVLDLLDQQFAAMDRADGDDRITALRQCIDRLTPRSRRLVELSYGQGLSGRQVAERIGRQLNTVYVTMARIHRTLRDCIASRLHRGQTE